MAKTTLTGMLDRLESSGHVQRAFDPGDRRKVFIRLTDAARGLKDCYDAVSLKMSEIFITAPATRLIPSRSFDMEAMNAHSACFFTQQLFLIGTYNEDGTPNFAPISWVSFTWGPPSCLVISVYGVKRKKRTTQNIERTWHLSATIVTPDLLPFAEQHNLATQREGVVLPQEVEAGTVLRVPLLKGAKWSYECEVIQSVRIGSCDTYFAAFKSVNVREDVQALDFIDLRAINPVVYSPDHYFTIGEHIGKIGDYAK